MAAELEYESVLCVKPDVSVYRIPPRASNRGYRYRVGFAAGARQDNDCVLGQHAPARAVAPERSLSKPTTQAASVSVHFSVLLELLFYFVFLLPSCIFPPILTIPLGTSSAPRHPQSIHACSICYSFCDLWLVILHARAFAHARSTLSLPHSSDFS